MLHWHGDTFDLPDGAKLLASTPACRNQAYQLGARVFGLQFHAETTAADVEKSLEADADYVVLANGDGRGRSTASRHGAYAWTPTRSSAIVGSGTCSRP